MFVKFLFYFVSLFVLLASFFLFSFVQIKEKIIMDCPKEPMAEKRSHTWQRLNGFYFSFFFLSFLSFFFFFFFFFFFILSFLFLSFLSSLILFPSR